MEHSLSEETFHAKITLGSRDNTPVFPDITDAAEMLR